MNKVYLEKIIEKIKCIYKMYFNKNKITTPFTKA